MLSARPVLAAATRVGGRRFPAPAAAAAAAAQRRAYAAVTDAAANPVKRHGGLRDQDRIFSNAYRQHDWTLKGAQVRRASSYLPTPRATRPLAIAPPSAASPPSRDFTGPPEEPVHSGNTPLTRLRSSLAV